MNQKLQGVVLQMRKLCNLLVGLSLTICLAGLSSASPRLVAPAQERNEAKDLQSQTKITMDDARATALKRAPGKVESGELEREHGRLVYSFDIRNSKGTITEVQVSAITGRIVRVEHENKKQEAAEKRAEGRKSHRQH